MMEEIAVTVVITMMVEMRHSIYRLHKRLRTVENMSAIEPKTSGLLRAAVLLALCFLCSCDNEVRVDVHEHRDLVDIFNVALPWLEGVLGLGFVGSVVAAVAFKTIKWWSLSVSLLAGIVASYTLGYFVQALPYLIGGCFVCGLIFAGWEAYTHRAKLRECERKLLNPTESDNTHA